MLCWIVTVMPCETPQLNTMEIGNEILVIMCAYYMMFFTDYVGDPELRYMFGWGYMAMLGAGLLGNLVNVLLSSCRKFKELII